MAELLCYQLHQSLTHQARLARAGDAGHRGEHPQRKGDIQVVQVVPSDTAQAQPALRRSRRPRRECGVAEKIPAGSGLLDLRQPVERAAVEDEPAVLARVRPHIHDPVGMAYHVQVVLHDEEGVTRGLEPVERRQQRLGISGMEPRGGLVQHVHDAEKIGVHLGGKPQALELPGREGGCAAIQRQVAQPQLEEDAEPRHQVLGNALGDHRLLRMLLLQFRYPGG